MTGQDMPRPATSDVARREKLSIALVADALLTLPIRERLLTPAGIAIHVGVTPNPR